jgi:hypothetical protein
MPSIQQASDIWVMYVRWSTSVCSTKNASREREKNEREKESKRKSEREKERKKNIVEQEKNEKKKKCIRKEVSCWPTRLLVLLFDKRSSKCQFISEHEWIDELIMSIP